MEKSGNGIGVIGLLGIVFVVLKLLGITKVAEWSWWWVTLPFWGAIALAMVLIFGVFAFAAAKALLNKTK